MMPPLQRLTEKVYSTKNQVWGSRTASQAWSHRKDPSSMTPVLLARVRCTAMVRSVWFRKMAFLGESGRRTMRKKEIKAVMAPRKRNRSCQLAMVCVWMLPIP